MFPFFSVQNIGKSIWTQQWRAKCVQEDALSFDTRVISVFSDFLESLIVEETGIIAYVTVEGRKYVIYFCLFKPYYINKLPLQT